MSKIHYQLFFRRTALYRALSSKRAHFQQTIKENQTMKKMLVRFVLLSLLVVSFASIALAQHGGKAEGKPIQFKRGATSATITDTIKNHLQYEYTFVAKEGQLATIKIASTPANSVTFKIMLDGEPVQGEVNEAGTEWSGSLPADGEYWIAVLRNTSKKGSSKFSLRLSIK